MERENAASGVYDLESGRHFCNMSEIPNCGGGGWTLAMKINDTKVIKILLSILYELKWYEILRPRDEIYESYKFDVVAIFLVLFETFSNLNNLMCNKKTYDLHFIKVPNELASL